MMKKTTLSAITLMVLATVVSATDIEVGTQKEVVPIRHREGEIEIQNLNTDQEVMVLRKDVFLEAEYGGSIISFQADEIRYEKAKGKIIAKGNVVVKQGQAVINAEECEYDINARQAILRGNPEYQDGETDRKNMWKGTEIVIYFSDKGVRRIIGKDGWGKVYPDKAWINAYLGGKTTDSAQTTEPVIKESSEALVIEPTPIQRKISE